MTAGPERDAPSAGSERGPQEDQHYRGWHLAPTTHDALTTEFEWAVLRYAQAFERWVVQLSGTLGLGELSYPEMVILHVVGMQDRPKTAAAIARQLNRDDIPNLQYCLRKLVKHGLCVSSREQRNRILAYELTDAGRTAVGAYARLREEILTGQSNNIDRIDERLRDAARLISLLTGVYDEAARIAATYSQADREPPREE